MTVVGAWAETAAKGKARDAKRSDEADHMVTAGLKESRQNKKRTAERGIK